MDFVPVKFPMLAFTLITPFQPCVDYLFNSSELPDASELLFLRLVKL